MPCNLVIDLLFCLPPLCSRDRYITISGIDGAFADGVTAFCLIFFRVAVGSFFTKFLPNKSGVPWFTGRAILLKE